ncbi:hypothetical protein [Flavobacterium nackdongense]|uniref:Outer membrane protein beta-barrel domain-containing protein n=1 Tax=Flavobacterium nackdongense TaxID=2547394 RepID=A0A4P6YG58_9FLAO|nr:hypothetical protein [Flavobacterium nackdongense]QBN19914.1 hypothetical protein E1750_14275 [Flavobacterium nackdongense]
MKNTKILLMLFFLVGKSFAQDNINRKVDPKLTNTYVVEYDFQTGTFLKNNLKIKVSNPVVFKITNINRLAYSVNIKASDSIIGYSDLSGLEDLLKKQDIENTKKEIAIIAKNTASPAAVVPVNKEDFIEKSKSSDIVKGMNNFQKDLSNEINEKLSEIAKDPNSSSNTKMNEIKIPKKLEEEFPFHFEAQKNLTEIYLEILQKHQKMISLCNDYLKIRAMINDPLLTKQMVDDKQILLDSIFTDFNKNKNIFSDFDMLYRRFQNLYTSIKSNPEIARNTNFGGSIKLFSIIDNQNIEVNSLKQQIDLLKYEKVRQDIIQIHRFLILNQDKTQLFEYVSEPIQPTQDIVIFKVDIKKNDKDQSLFFNERKFSHKEFTKYGLRLDLSLGCAGSYHNKDNFYDMQVNSKNENVIVEKNTVGFTPSFVGLFTTSLRSASNWTYGLSVGLGISADEGTIAFDNFFVGPSIIIGKYERVAVTTGVSFKSLPTLNSSYKVGDIVPNAFTLENVSTKSYQAGFFLSLTYNITKGVKENIKQASKLL